MQSFKSVAAVAALVAASGSGFSLVGALEDKQLVSFAENLNTNFQEVNDPVMGGQSVGNFTDEGHFGLFQGVVKNVTFLQAPGFCNIQMYPGLLHQLDLSEYVTDDLSGGLKLRVGYAQPAGEQPFATYRFGLSASNIPKHGGQAHELEGQYKGNFVVKPPPASTNLKAAQCQTVTIPFKAFSSDWSDFNGECGGTDPDGTVHKCCSSDSPDVCPTADRVRKVDAVSVWAEGVEGPFALKIYEINVTADATSAPAVFGPC